MTSALKHSHKTPHKRIYNLRDLEHIPWLENMPKEEKFAMRVVANILPFRTNNYILENLIDWQNGPEDPIFRLNFMHRDMLLASEFKAMAEALRRKAPAAEIKTLANQIRLGLNPHPAGQLTENVPTLEGKPVPGIQHKYRETCLVFPANSQTCFAYCTFCFRWPQFVDLSGYKFSTDGSKRYLDYIKYHREITDVLITGGDPMTMSTKNFIRFTEPFLEPEFEHVQNIRIGTKALGHWPYRFTTDHDAEELLRFFEKIVRRGKHLAFMAHFTHPAELRTEAVKKASRRIRSTGAIIRTQSPVIRKINDNPEIWTDMWREQVKLGMIPYYMFIERDTGPHNHFELPLYRTLEIYRQAAQRVSGLSRTVRGPSMSTYFGKACLEGLVDIHDEKLFALNFLQARDPDWIKRPFFAPYDPNAVWLDDLVPAFGEKKFFFQKESPAPKDPVDALLGDFLT